ncbi:hypothetical protein RclHR1_12540001 [Rhizophagus clarus]|uniref:SWIM-type domain-containing protein n=1 Tax=Rhizophagus clarus TaxID=94130 RepID=A0A2Z6Q948_9GLOM|nr:hypothetical protein RclHR1_12540001 [Rhizophagus clarus]
MISSFQNRVHFFNQTKVNDCHEEFAILGSTGNVYTVTIIHKPNCSCPDFKKGYLCKHIFFVYLKVFRLNHDSQFIYQEVLLSKELRLIFANAVPDPTVLASKKVCDKYSTFTSSKLENKTGKNKKRKPIEGNCPVCYELLKEKDHNNIVICVYCHANWVDPDSEILINEEGYINLGRAQEINTIRGYRKLSKLETEFVCDESTTNSVDILIYKELNVEQKEYYPSIKMGPQLISKIRNIAGFGNQLRLVIRKPANNSQTRK